MKEEFTSKVDELIGEDKREEYAKIKKNISREMTKMHDRTDRSYIRAKKTFERQSDGCVKKIFRSSCRTEKTYG